MITKNEYVNKLSKVKSSFIYVSDQELENSDKNCQSLQMWWCDHHKDAKGCASVKLGFWYSNSKPSKRYIWLLMPRRGPKTSHWFYLKKKKGKKVLLSWKHITTSNKEKNTLAYSPCKLGNQIQHNSKKQLHRILIKNTLDLQLLEIGLGSVHVWSSVIW